MPAFFTRAFVVLALLAIGVSTAWTEPAPVAMPRWLVQISFPALSKPSDIPPDAYSGRVEVYQNDTFVGCAWAVVYEPTPGVRRLAPINLGFTATGSKDTIHAEAFGELQRLGGMTVKITELNSATADAPAK